MTYEFRSFKQIKDISPAQKKQFSLLDIYILKQGCANIGIKIRNPTLKEYGWKMKSFECKISITLLQKGLKQPQLWHKFVIPCEHKLKWLEKSEEQLQQKIHKLNKWMSNALSLQSKNIAISIGKGGSKQTKFQVDEMIKRWCDKEIKEAYFVHKNKHKIMGKQHGTVMLESFINKSISCFQTIAQEHSKVAQFGDLGAFSSLNTSYPQLLENIYRKYCQSTDSKS